MIKKNFPVMYQYVITVLSQTLNYKWFPPGPAVSSINKTDNHNITEILLQVALQKKLNYKVFFLCHLSSWILIYITVNGILKPGTLMAVMGAR
jgi:hypothetical protein